MPIPQAKMAIIFDTHEISHAFHLLNIFSLTTLQQTLYNQEKNHVKRNLVRNDYNSKDMLMGPIWAMN